MDGVGRARVLGGVRIFQASIRPAARCLNGRIR
jgi:hypothetical protein